MRVALMLLFVAACETPASDPAGVEAPAAPEPAVQTPAPSTEATAAPALPDGRFSMPDGATLEFAGGKARLVQSGGVVDITVEPAEVAGRPGMRLQMATGPVDVFRADDGTLVLGDGTGALAPAP